MLYIEFDCVFQNLGPRGRVLSLGMLGLSLGGKSGNSRFGFLARAKDSSLERPSFVQSSARAKKWWLERKFQALRILVRAGVRSSEETYARAKSCVSRSSEHRAEKINNQYFFILTDRSSEVSLARANPLILQARSSEGSLTRARPLFSATFEKCFLSTSLHPHPILGILRPSLRHLNEDIDVEHTEVN